MRDGRLFSIRDIAQELGLPESTVRYYRNAFAAYLPAIGSGRRRRYPAQAIPVLRLVAEGYAQNRSRPEIEHAVSELLRDNQQGTLPAVSAPSPLVVRTAGEEVLAQMLDGERERREVMWQMARELVRLGEVIERQQGLLAGLAERVAGTAAQASGAGEAAGAAAAAGDVPLISAAAAAPAAAFGDEIESLRRALAEERDLVERLRRSRLDFERRAADAEAKLNNGSPRRAWLFGKSHPPESDAPR